jgi:hypothetical protein
MQGPLVHTCTDSLKVTCLLQEIPQYPSFHLQQEGRQLVPNFKLAVRLMGISRRECSMQGPLVHTCTDGLKAPCLLQEIPQYPSLHLQQEGRQLVAKLSWQSVLWG